MPATLSEDEIDDLLYFARTGENEEFNILKEELCKRESIGLVGLLESARDEMSGNGVLHMAGANGHNGKLSRGTLPARHARLTFEARASENPLLRTFEANAAKQSNVGDHKRAESGRKHSAALGCTEWTLRSSESLVGTRW